MEDAAIPPERVFGGTPESVEFRRTHYRVYDEDGFASSFATGSPENATLTSVSERLCARFRGTWQGAPRYRKSKDLVVAARPAADRRRRPRLRAGRGAGRDDVRGLSHRNAARDPASPPGEPRRSTPNLRGTLGVDSRAEKSAVNR